MTKLKLRIWLLSALSVIFLTLLIAGISTTKELSLSFSYDPIVFIPFFSVVTNIVLLITIAKRRRYIKSILWFCVCIISAVFWGIGDMMTFLANNRETGLLARSLVPVTSLFGVSALVIFVSDITSDDADMHLGSRLLLVANTLLYFVVNLSTSLIINKDPASLVQRYWGFETVFGPFGLIYLLWSQFVIIYVAGLLTKYYLSRKKKEQKKQARIFLIGILIPLFGSTFTNIIPAIFGIPVLPLDSLFITIMAVMITYGITKYQLFVINPTQISNNILETMAESVIVTDRSFEIQYANQNAKNIFKLDGSVDGVESKITNYFKEADFEKIANFVKENKVIKDSKKFTDLSVSLKNSKEIPVEISISSISSEDKKRGAGYVFVLSDVSELQKAYSKLAEEEKKVERKVIERTEQLYEEHTKLVASISGLPIGFIMLDDEMHVLEQNAVAKRLLGARSEGRWYIKEALEHLGIKESFLESSKSGQILDIPELKANGKLLHIIFSPILADHNKKLGNVILIEDITAQKIAEKERSEFIVTASHEIRTPLSIIQGYLSNALEIKGEVSPKVKPLITKAYGASNQISALFKDILIVSDIENASSPKPKFETQFVLQVAIQEVVDSLEDKAKQKNTKLIYQPKGYQYEVRGDRDEIKEAISKLIDNGIKFTAKGAVEIALSKKNNQVVIRVIDTGKGIKSAEKSRLFKKFVRLDNSLKREVGGAGLGLYIAKALSNRNYGDLELESSSAKGSVFCLTLPLAD